MNDHTTAQQAINPYGTEAHKLARRDDPDTSRDAAQSVETTRLERLVHHVIASFPNGCISSEVLAKFPNLSYSSVTARFSALERKGLISCGPDRRKGDSGRSARVMRSLKKAE